jgi:hypothetical protein
LRGRGGGGVGQVGHAGLDFEAVSADHLADGLGYSDSVAEGGLEPFDVRGVEVEVEALSRFFFSSGHFTKYTLVGWSSKRVTEILSRTGSLWVLRAA